MTTEWKPKPISEIPKDLYQKLWGGLDGDGLELRYWASDDEQDLFLYLSPQEVRKVEDYGVTDELVEWMRDNDMFKMDIGFANDEPFDVEVFTINDEVVTRFYAT